MVNMPSCLASLSRLKDSLVGVGGTCNSPKKGSYLSEMRTRSWWGIFGKNCRNHNMRTQQVFAIVQSIESVLQADACQRIEEQFKAYGEGIKCFSIIDDQALQNLTKSSYNLIRKTMNQIQQSYSSVQMNRSELYVLLKVVYDHSAGAKAVRLDH